MQFLSLRYQGSSLVPYAKAWELQKLFVEKRVRDEIPDSFLFVDHPPTVTRGRGLQWNPSRAVLPSQTPASSQAGTTTPQSDETVEKPVRAMPLGPLPEGTEYFEIERGGDLTWHGPGQLVIYPIVKLDGKGFGPNHDVTGFLRKLEASLARWLEPYGLRVEPRENATGVWVVPGSGDSALSTGKEKGTESREPTAKKIASIGIAVRKWVTYHGIGLNISNTLEGYREISPCGFSPEVMTTLSQVRGPQAVSMDLSVKRDQIEKELALVFSGQNGSVVERWEVDGSAL